uniref:Uncharacterized protein n=1 Tax=Meloidogyne enterolobii TaxID=390850 RepID=A0A6V7V8M3_MELEN|nr:unnamed protein product [Meloidogyne enterolobii]
MEKIVFDDQIDIDLNVSIDDNNMDLKSCLESYFQILQTDECQRCGNKNAPALTYLWRLPEVLIIHLGRGKPDGTKNNRFNRFSDAKSRYDHLSTPKFS